MKPKKSNIHLSFCEFRTQTIDLNNRKIQISFVIVTKIKIRYNFGIIFREKHNKKTIKTILLHLFPYF